MINSVSRFKGDLIVEYPRETSGESQTHKDGTASDSGLAGRGSREVTVAACSGKTVRPR